jgi:hypothetical protein
MACSPLLQSATSPTSASWLNPLYLTLHDRYRAWKGFDLDVLNRLPERGLIEDPVNKTKSVIFTEEGLRESDQLFNQQFVIPEKTGN